MPQKPKSGSARMPTASPNTPTTAPTSTRTAGESMRHGAASPSGGNPSAPALPPIAWGVFLHPSVFRVNASAKDVFWSLHRNGGLPAVAPQPSPTATPPSVVSYLSSGNLCDVASRAEHAAAKAAAVAAQAAAAAASPLLPPAPRLSTFPVSEARTASAAAAGQPTPSAETPGKTSAPACVTHHANPLLAYSASGNHPQLVSFDFTVSRAVPTVHTEDAAVWKALAREPLCQQLRSSRMNALEELLPGSTEHPPLPSPHLLPRSPAAVTSAAPSVSGGEHASPAAAAAATHSDTAASSPQSAAEQTRLREIAALLAVVSGGSPPAADPHTAAPEDAAGESSGGLAAETLRQQAALVQQCLYGSRRSAGLQLFLYTPAPELGQLTGSVMGHRVGCGEGAGLDGSSLLSGLQIALASMQEGEEASFFIASPQGFRYTAPPLPVGTPSVKHDTYTGTAYTGAGGGGGGGAPGSPAGRQQRSASDSRNSRSSSSSSDDGSSSSSSAGHSTGVGLDKKGRRKDGSPRRSMRERLGLQRSHRGGKGDKHKGKAKEGLTDGATHNSRSSSALLPNNGVSDAAVALRLMWHGSTEVLFYTVRLVQRVPLMRVMPVSAALSQCFLSLPRGAAGGGGGTSVVIPRPAASTRGMLKRLSSSWGRGGAAAAAATPSPSAPSVPSGCVNPLAFFARANFSGGLLRLVEQLNGRMSPSSAGAVDIHAVAPFVATFAQLESCRGGLGSAAAAAAIGSEGASTSAPSLSPPTLLSDVEGVIQRVLGNDKSVRQAQMAALTATLFVLGPHLNMREVASASGGASGDEHAVPSASAPPSASARTEGSRFEAFSFLDGLNECVEADPCADDAASRTAAATSSSSSSAAAMSTLRVAYDPTRYANAGLRFLDKDFLTYHQLSSNVFVQVQAYNPLTQKFYSVNTFAHSSSSSSSSSSSASAAGGPQGGAGGKWSVTIGSVVVPCWLDLVCRGVPRHHSIASVVYLVGDASDESFMTRLLTDIRQEAQRFLEEVEQVRAQAMEHVQHRHLESAGRAGGAAEKGEGDRLADSVSGANAAAAAASLPTSSSTSPSHAPLAAAPGDTAGAAHQASVRSAGLDAAVVAAAVTAATNAAPTPSGNAATAACASHFTSADAAASRRATAPSALQRRLETTFRLLLDSPSAPATGPTADGSGSGRAVVSSSSSPAVRKGSFFFTNPSNSCTAVRSLLVEACGLLSYYDTQRTRVADGLGDVGAEERGSPVSGGGEGRSRLLFALVGGHRTSLALLLEDPDLSEMRLEEEVQSLLKPDVLDAIEAAAASTPAAVTSRRDADHLERREAPAGPPVGEGDGLGLTPSPTSATYGNSIGAAAAAVPPPPPDAVVALVTGVATAVNPSLVVKEYFTRQHGKFARRAEKGSQASALNALLLGSASAAVIENNRSAQSDGSGTAAAAAVPLDVVAAASAFLPSTPMAPELREHCVRQRILFKVLERLYTCIFLLTFNVDEDAVRPVRCGDQYDCYFPAAASRPQSVHPPTTPKRVASSRTLPMTSSTDDHTTTGNTERLCSFSAAMPSTSVDVSADMASGKSEDAQQQHQTLRRRRYGYLAEVYHYVALVYAEMEGMTSHAMDAVAAGLLYAPHDEELWMLRAVLMARQRQYLRASLDLDIAAALTERRLQSTRSSPEGEEAPGPREGETATAAAAGAKKEEGDDGHHDHETIRFFTERLALLRLQQQGVSALQEDARGGVGGGRRSRRSSGGGAGIFQNLASSASLGSAAGSALGGGTPANANVSLTALAAAVTGTAGGSPAAGAGASAAMACAGAATSFTSLPVMGSGLLAANGAGIVLS